ncbi:MAG TPA: hypothetical protein VLJ88_12710 [Propionibacteriaceae bacterium]|nr:hypothetical protein [Propionibacteriaceae bacterium]
MTVRLPLVPEPDFSTTVGPWTFTRNLVVTGPTAEMFFQLYLQAFEPLRTKAAARQVLTRDEFFEHLADPRVDKYVAWQSASEPVGITTLTKHLHALPWISAEYYAARYPEEWSRNAVYYLGFTLCQPGVAGGFQAPDRPNFLETLIQIGIGPLIAERGVIAYDVCSHNNEALNLPDRIAAVLDRHSDARAEVLDTQVYYGVSFR